MFATKVAEKASADEKSSAAAQKPLWHVQSSLLSYPLQQRQEVCPCGGGCPRCVQQQSHHPTTGAELVTTTDGSFEQHADIAGASPSPQLVPQNSSFRLDTSLRSFFEPRLGHDFGGVRIHNDARAAELASGANARAYTIGRDIVFGAGQYAPHTAAGRRLLAHELTHVVQQSDAAHSHIRPGGSRQPDHEFEARAIAEVVNSGGRARPMQRIPLQMARDGPDVPAATVQYIEISTGSNEIIFRTGGDSHRYSLSQTGLQPGSYRMAVRVSGNRVQLTAEAGSPPMTGSWRWRIRPGQENPATLLRDASSVEVRVTDQPFAPLPPSPDEQRRDPNAVYLTPEEAQRRCDANDLPVMTFPMRTTRFGAAPIMAWRDGNVIRVHQPVYVRNNRDFRAQTRTLPIDVFTSGTALESNQIVRVRLYMPHWYHTNVTGDATGDEQREFCVTGEQMLQLSAACDRALAMNIALTAIDALPFVPGVGTAIGQGVSRVTAAVTSRVIRPGVTAMVIGTAEAAPVALGGAASRAPSALVTEAAGEVTTEAMARQATSRIVEQATAAAPAQIVTQGIGAAAEAALPRVVPSLAPQVVGVSLTEAGVEAIANTVQNSQSLRALRAASAETAGGAGPRRPRRPRTGSPEPPGPVIPERRHVRQIDPYGCGGASGEMCAEHHGVTVTEAELLTEPGFTPGPSAAATQAQGRVASRGSGFYGPGLVSALERRAPVPNRVWVYADLLPANAGASGYLTQAEIRAALVAGLQRGNGIFIASVDGGAHWIVVDGFQGGMVFIRDPATQAASAIPLETLVTRWLGEAVVSVAR